MQIRPAHQLDARAFATFLIELDWFSYVKGKSFEEILQVCERNLAVESDRVLLVAVEGETILGYANLVFNHTMWLPGPSAYLSELFIHPEARGKGVGSALINAVIDAATQANAYRIMLNNSRERDSYTRGFYLKHGFEERPEMANFVLKLHGKS